MIARFRLFPQSIVAALGITVAVLVFTLFGFANAASSTEHDHGHGDQGLEPSEYDPVAHEAALSNLHSHYCDDFINAAVHGQAVTDDLRKSGLMSKVPEFPASQNVSFHGCMSENTTGEAILALNVGPDVVVVVSNSPRLKNLYLDNFDLGNGSGVSDIASIHSAKGRNVADLARSKRTQNFQSLVERASSSDS